jgi:heterodisulfide reductase subunit B
VFLVEKGANLMIKTRAKTALWQVVNDSRIERLIKEFKKRAIFRRLGLQVPAYHYP